jgi:DNA-binding transcriptional regulator PaaX
MRFEINISLNGQHWGKIILPESWTGEELAKLKVKYLQRLAGHMFEFTLTEWIEEGHVIPV